MKEEIKSMREILDRLEGSLAKPEEKEVRLEDGFAAGLDGSVIVCKGYTKDSIKKWYDHGHWFPTREEAEKESKHRALIQKMRGFTKGFVPDWNDINHEKYGIIYDFIDKSFYFTSYFNTQGHGLFEIYFRTKEDAQACIDAMGDEIRSVL